MYRKSMRSALEEARAYSAVNEVKVSKGGKTLNISKKDVEVYQAKGWSLQEANMKRILQALQDKLSDEGGAAGFDDLKKTAKSMGLNLTPAMLKDMPGIKQHRDGDYILEAKTVGGALAQGHLETMTDQRFKEFYGMTKDEYIKKHGDPRKEELDEALEVKWDSNKQGWFDKQGRRRYLGKMATNKLMSKAIDKAKETGDFINPFKLKHGQKPEEVNTDTYADSKKKMLNKEEVVKEAFSKNDFAKLEATNDHTEAAVKLINMFGTKEEKFKMAAIKARHNMTGYITGPDSRERLAMVNKYYSRLK